VTAASASKPILRALTGCTAVGKTAWALRWAETRNAEIVSCDSLLFYRGMNIGTAKPTAAELARIPHHLINCCDLTERMDIARFVELARAALKGIVERGREALVVGGSGFYLKALFAPVADHVQVEPGIREEVARFSAAEALEKLRLVNPAGLGALDISNPRRVVRALERCLASGQNLLTLADNFSRQPAPFAEWDVVLTQIDRAPTELAERISDRVNGMLTAGLVDEVRTLLGAGLKENPSAARAIGYREVIEFLEGRLPESALASEIAKNTRALVKKQRTWFRTQLPEHTVVLADQVRTTSELFPR